MSLISDAELLALGLAQSSLSDVAMPVRDQHRAAASGIVESKLARRYRLPLQAVSGDVKLAVAMIASYTLLAYRGYRPQPGTPDEVKERYDTAMAWLDDIVDGRAELRGEQEILAPLVASDGKRWMRVDFLSGTDPYGVPWSPLKPSTLAKGRFPPPLTDKGKLKAGTFGKPLRGIGVAIVVADLHYAMVHMTGRADMDARKYIPDRGLPATWRDDIRTLFRNAVRQGFLTS